MITDNPTITEDLATLRRTCRDLAGYAASGGHAISALDRVEAHHGKLRDEIAVLRNALTKARAAIEAIS